MPYSVLPISGVDLNGITPESFEYTNGTTLIVTGKQIGRAHV